MSAGVLVIEDEIGLGNNIKKYLERYEYDVHLVRTGSDGIAQCAEFQPDIALIDYQLPDMNGLEILRHLHRKTKIVMMTGHGSVEIAVDAMKAGAYDYVTKPIVLSELKLLIERARGQERLETRLSYYQSKQSPEGGLEAILGSSPAVQALRAQVQRVLNAEAELRGSLPPPVLVTGATGTGKELVARAIHFDGSRRSGPFVELNCACLPEHLVESELFGHERGAFTDAKERRAGLIEAADGGTLFLDELGELPLSAQAKLLKVLEDQVVRPVGSVRDKKVSVRIIAATNRPIEKMIAAGDFRSDLYFRLQTIVLSVPPLRDRGSDIEYLAQHFLKIHAKRYKSSAVQFADSATRTIVSHHWPGNVRELSNVIERAVLLSETDRILPDELSLSTIVGSNHPVSEAEQVNVLPPHGVDLESLEQDLVIQALQRTSWNVSRAARLLGLTRDTLRYRIEKYELDRRA